MLDRIGSMVTGSDLALMLEAKATFPGHRGSGDVVDFHLRPLSFNEVFCLEHGPSVLSDLQVPYGGPFPDDLEPASGTKRDSLVHGGFPRPPDEPL